ncbi:uncharacterized protein LOC108632909 isoform X2 [Ceratina calcarata]|nr:uncharacterized protein LOC108632909 isoform X2 [Ceratina calcarata]XP_026666594.1 uncharacterized protein LOC108632909 isoform X2 [Ceratina calcarata]XP_026666595.1 uncharacterized protein LOC108632909 isoform X2 [Ceratina calcarata]XP_026666596.1 uncharacterized protein LOC108632909 isoform X2 [Ceratina calcarata]
MTYEAAEESNSENEEYFISSDESDTDSDDNEHYSDDERNIENNTIFHLNKFYADHADNTPRHLPPRTRNIEFREKIYRVIPLKLDERIFNTVSSNDKISSDLRRNG